MLMQFFQDYNKSNFFTLKDLPGTRREAFMHLPGVLTYHRLGMERQIHIYQSNNEDVVKKLSQWYTEINAFLQITDAKLKEIKNAEGQKIGIACHYDHEKDTDRLDSFVFCPYAMFLNFPFIKRFHMKGLRLPDGTKFFDDDTWVRLIVRNDALIFALEVIHEGHDYTLREPRHLIWAQRVIDNLLIEQASLEYDVEFFLACEEDFSKLYSFLTVHAFSTTYH